MYLKKFQNRSVAVKLYKTFTKQKSPMFCTQVDERADRRTDRWIARRRNGKIDFLPQKTFCIAELYQVQNIIY